MNFRSSILSICISISSGADCVKIANYRKKEEKKDKLTFICIFKARGFCFPVKNFAEKVAIARTARNVSHEN